MLCYSAFLQTAAWHYFTLSSSFLRHQIRSKFSNNYYFLLNTWDGTLARTEVWRCSVHTQNDDERTGVQLKRDRVIF
jgi:hypothetical protein